jgi:hypothetical protein
MNKILLFLFTLLNLSLFAQTEPAAEVAAEETAPAPAFTFSGSVDVYFRRNLNSSNNPENIKGDVSSTLAPGTSFANLPGFSVGMANLIGTYTNGNVKFVSDLVFGPRGKDAVFNSPAGLNIVNQAYVAYTTGKTTFTLGKFNTFLGYEVISPVLNTHYSTSYMFSYGPFNHTGLKVGFDLGGGFSALAAIMNPTDFTDFNPTNEYVGGAQLGYSKGAVTAYLNGILADGYNQFDLTAILKPIDKYTLGINATTAKESFAGVAIYNTVAASDKLDVAARVEYFKDNGIGILQGTDPSVVDVTLSLGIKAANFRLIPEYRFDVYGSKENLKPVITDAIKGKSAKSLSSFVLAAVANF